MPAIQRRANKSIRSMTGLPVGYINCRLSIAIALLATLAPAMAHAATTYQLQESPQAAARTQVGFVYEVRGALSMRQDNKVVKLPLKLDAKMNFYEQVMRKADHLEEGELQVDRRLIRKFVTVQTNMQIQEANFSPELSDDQRLIGVQMQDQRRVCFAPKDRLTRDELELVQIPCDTGLIDLLLPKTKVAVGDTWEIPAEALGLLLTIDAVGKSEVTCELKSVEGQVASLEASGDVLGAVGGVATEVSIKTRLQFDLKRKLITHVEWVTKEKRAIGHVGPGVDVIGKQRLQRMTLASGEVLKEEEIARIKFPAANHLTALDFVPVSKRYRLIHHREWHVTGDQQRATVLRLVQRGELIAQCNITPQTTRDEGVPSTMSEFRTAVEKTLGDQFGRFLEATEEEYKQSKALRLVAIGTVQDLPIQWTYYLFSKGDQRVIMAFTVEGSLVEKFAAADRQLAEQLQLTPPPAEKTATADKSAVKK